MTKKYQTDFICLGKQTRIPTKWFNHIFYCLELVESRDQLFEITLDIKSQIGFENFAYGLIIPNNFRSEIFCITSDEPEEWKQLYCDQELWKIDTRIFEARKNFSAFYWDKLNPRADFITQKLMQDCFNGMTIPVHGPNNFFGFFHFTFVAKQKKINCWLKYIQPFLLCLVHKITAIQYDLYAKGKLFPGNENELAGEFRLTLAQRRCLSWAAEGKTTEEIGLILGISPSTVNKHLNFASELLNANNRIHTITKALDAKLIGLEYKRKSSIFYF